LAARIADPGQLERHVADERLDALGLREALLEHLLEVHRRQLEVVLQHEVVEVEHLAEPRREALALEQVGDAHRATGHLVLVGGADAAAGRADRVRAAGPLAGEVELHVRGQDQRAVRADAQLAEHRHAARGEHVGFLQERRERKHHAVADEALHVFAQHAGGDERQDRLLAADHERVARVVPALEPGDRGGPLGEQVDDLALALVAPLGADDHDHAAHGNPQLRTNQSSRSPATIATSPATRSCPSGIALKAAIARFIPCGFTKGSIPSITRYSAKAAARSLQSMGTGRQRVGLTM
jgi:hypothetical protein